MTTTEITLCGLFVFGLMALALAFTERMMERETVTACYGEICATATVDLNAAARHVESLKASGFCEDYPKSPLC